MSLIFIDKNILINTDRIDAIELVTLRGQKVVNVYVNGKRFTATLEPNELLRQFKQSGLDLTKQYFAG